MSRILLLGSRGRLGAALARAWSPDHDVTALARPQIDVADLLSLEKLLAEMDFEILVNATAQANVDQCEADREEAERINARAPGVMARAAEAKNARLIHFSTDYVFDGTKTAPYTETDPARPLSHYGRTKLAGEEAVLAAGPRHLVFRVSWVFGPDKPCFIDMLLDWAMQRDRVEAIADKTSSPSYTEDIARWIPAFFDRSQPGGIYHACNTGTCSWKEWGERTLRAAKQAGAPLRTTAVDPLRLDDMKAFVAPRPRHTAMDVTKLAGVLGFTPRPWQDAVEEYVLQKFPRANSE